MATVLTISIFAISALAEETEETVTEMAETVEAVETEIDAEDTVDDELIANPFYGVWYACGDNVGSGGDIYILPDGTFLIGTETLRYEQTDDTHIQIQADEDSTLIGEFDLLTQEDIDEFGVSVNLTSLYDASIGAAKIVFTLSYPDPENPLATSPATDQILALFRPDQGDFLRMVMAGKTWKIGDHTLEIDENGNLDLNNGASTGLADWGKKTDSPMYVAFRWKDGRNVEYIPDVSTAEQIELVQIGDPDDVITLVLDDTLENK